MAKKQTAAVKLSETMQVPSEKEFNSLVRAVRNANADINDTQAVKSGLIKKAVDKIHLHKKAFATFQSAARLSDKALSEYMAHVEHYFEVGGLNDRASRQGDMIGREKELAETKVEQVEANGGRKKRGAKKATGKIESQRQREDAAEFDGEVAGEAVH